MADQHWRKEPRLQLPCSLMLTQSRGLMDACAQVRARERDVKTALLPHAEEDVLRAITVGGASSAQGIADDATLRTEEFWDRCLSLKGEPWSDAPNRRKMRERVRTWRHVLEREAWIPSTRDKLIALWSEATEGEFPMYREAKHARFRTKGTPFAHGRIPFELEPLLPGAQTAAPDEIPAEVDRLLAFIADDSIPLEIRAVAAYFAHGAVHPFRDGNGRCGRLLSCSILSPAYSLPTLLAYTARLQGARSETGVQIRAVVGGSGDAEPACKFLIGLLVEAQEDVLAMID